MAQEIKGTVYWTNPPDRVTDAVVIASGPDPQANRVVAYTDDDGDYSFDLSQQPIGDWMVQVLHPDGVPSVPAKRTIEANVTPEVLDFRLRRWRSTLDRTGWTFFIFLIVGFLAAIAVYLLLHRDNPPARIPVDAKLNALVLLAADDMTQLSEDDDLENIVALPLPRLQRLAEEEDLTDNEREALIGFADRIQVAVVNDDRAALREELANLSLHLEDLTRSTGYFWTEDPWRMVEIVLIALIAVFASKIVEVAWYLRRGSFYPEGISVHIGHILVNPLFVLAVVLIISLGSFQLTLANESSITIDLSNSIVLISVSLLLGIVPWRVLRFIQDTAERILGSRSSANPSE